MPFAFLGLPRLEIIETNTGYHAAQPHLLDRFRRPVKMMIHIGEGRRAALYHLQASQLGAPVHVLARQLRLVRPNLLFQPRHQGHIVAKAAEQRHGGVRMPVHQAGDYRLPPPVDHPVRRE